VGREQLASKLSPARVRNLVLLTVIFPPLYIPDRRDWFFSSALNLSPVSE